MTMRTTWLYVLLAVCLSSCVNKPPARTFSLVDYRHYRTELHPLAAESGRELLKQFCFTPPPGCESNSIACSIHPEYPGASWRYHYEVRRLPAVAPGERAYYVKSVRLEPQTSRAYVFEPEHPGRVVMWNNIARDPSQRGQVWEYLRTVGGEDEARTRLDYLDKMAREIRWHEQQHVREGILFNRELEKIMNTPAGYPRRLVLTGAQRPDEVLARSIEHDRDTRIQALLARNAACAEKFHARENRPESYASLLGQCACYGGWACHVKLPPPPRGNFKCDLPLPAATVRIASAKLRR